MKITLPPSGYLRVKVTPKSPKTELTEIAEENIDGKEVTTHRIHLKAAPEKGKANEELIRFLAKELALPRTAFSIISGKTDRIKLIRISHP